MKFPKHVEAVVESLHPEADGECCVMVLHRLEWRRDSDGVAAWLLAGSHSDGEDGIRVAVCLPLQSICEMVEAMGFDVVEPAGGRRAGRGEVRVSLRNEGIHGRN
jgi:hypothetical protein